MQGLRSERLADLLKQEIADILTTKIRDGRIGFVTVTGLNVSGDLRNATIYLSLQAKKNEKKVFAALEKASGFVRGELAKRLSLRRIPALTFAPDQGTERVSGLLGVLDEIAFERNKAPEHEAAQSSEDGGNIS